MQEGGGERDDDDDEKEIDVTGGMTVNKLEHYTLHIVQLGSQLSLRCL